jgi:hypothetical protein
MSPEDFFDSGENRGMAELFTECCLQHGYDPFSLNDEQQMEVELMAIAELGKIELETVSV